MQIGIYTPDASIFPNLAAMQISAYHKQFGDIVHLNPDVAPSEFDLSYSSITFPWTEDPTTTFVGGPKYLNSFLPDKMLSLFPDYSLYPEFEGSIGFTYRGCPNKCWFCDNHRFPTQSDFRSIGTFHSSGMSKITIFDVNFVASPWFEQSCHEILDLQLNMCLPNGIDARRVTKAKAELLAKIPAVPHVGSIGNPELTVAWDTPSDEKSVLNGIANLHEAGIIDLRCYVLLSDRTTMQEDLHRIVTLSRLNVKPVLFLQDPNNSEKVKIYFHLQTLYPELVSCSTITFNFMDRAAYHPLTEIPDKFELTEQRLSYYGR